MNVKLTLTEFLERIELLKKEGAFEENVFADVDEMSMTVKISARSKTNPLVRCTIQIPLSLRSIADLSEKTDALKQVMVLAQKEPEPVE